MYELIIIVLEIIWLIILVGIGVKLGLIINGWWRIGVNFDEGDLIDKVGGIETVILVLNDISERLGGVKVVLKE